MPNNNTQDIRELRTRIEALEEERMELFAEKQIHETRLCQLEEQARHGRNASSESAPPQFEPLPEAPSRQKKSFLARFFGLMLRVVNPFSWRRKASVEPFAEVPNPSAPPPPSGKKASASGDPDVLKELSEVKNQICEISARLEMVEDEIRQIKATVASIVQAGDRRGRHSSQSIIDDDPDSQGVRI